MPSYGSEDTDPRHAEDKLIAEKGWCCELYSGAGMNGRRRLSLRKVGFAFWDLFRVGG